MTHCGRVCSWFLALALLPGMGKAQNPDVIERGKYLATAGNCVSCHTQKSAIPFSGGVGFDTPFGTIFSTNITSDRDTGIGKWTVNDFRRAMHEGLDDQGSHLLPAFPYTAFTKVTDADVESIFAYLQTLRPVKYEPPSNSPFFRVRWPLAIWNFMFVEQGRYLDNPAQSAEWNRGAYLVEGLGHCGACHTPRNLLMAEDSQKSYAGGVLQERVPTGQKRRWSAVNLSSSKSGLASWSVNDLTKYLHTGFSSRAGSFGPMNEVIVNSLMALSQADVRAMAVYIKGLPARDEQGAGVSVDQVKAGEGVYKSRCEKCHSTSGRGGMFSGPPVAGSAIVLADDPSSLLNIILYGPEIPKDISTGSWETMPSYGDILNDAEIAAVSNFLRGSWDNKASPVTENQVAVQR